LPEILRPGLYYEQLSEKDAVSDASYAEIAVG